MARDQVGENRRAFAGENGIDRVPIDLVELEQFTIFQNGAGEAGAYPNIARASRSWFPYRQRGLSSGLVWTFGRLGGGIAPVLIFLLAAALTWRGAFLALGVLGLVSGTLYFARFCRGVPMLEGATVQFLAAALAGLLAVLLFETPHGDWTGPAIAATAWNAIGVTTRAWTPGSYEP